MTPEDVGLTRNQHRDGQTLSVQRCVKRLENLGYGIANHVEDVFVRSKERRPQERDLTTTDLIDLLSHRDRP